MDNEVSNMMTQRISWRRTHLLISVQSRPEYLCQVTKEVPVDPVYDEHGILHERRALLFEGRVVYEIPESLKRQIHSILPKFVFV